MTCSLYKLQRMWEEIKNPNHLRNRAAKMVSCLQNNKDVSRQQFMKMSSETQSSYAFLKYLINQSHPKYQRLFFKGSLIRYLPMAQLYTREVFQKKYFSHCDELATKVLHISFNKVATLLTRDYTCILLACNCKPTHLKKKQYHNILETKSSLYQLELIMIKYFNPQIWKSVCLLNCQEKEFSCF